MSKNNNINNNNNNNKSIKFVILNTLIILFYSKNIQITPFIADTDQFLRLNQIKYINQPNRQFDKIYKRQVYEVVNNTTQQFSPCKQSPAEIQFYGLGYYQLFNSQGDIYFQPSNPSPKHQRIIYDFQQLKRKYHNILDMYYLNSTIYTISSMGVLNIYRINDNSIYDKNGYNLMLVKSIKTVDFKQYKEKYNSTEEYLKKGYFVDMINKKFVMFCNNGFVILVHVLDGYRVEVFSSYNSDYKQKILFQTVIKIDETHFATLQHEKGVKFYQISSIDNKSFNISLTNQLNSQYLNLLQISSQNNKFSLVDMTYDSSRQILFILDSQLGILSFNKQPFLLGNNSSKQMQFRFTFNMIRKKMCNLIIYSQQQENIYLQCNKIYKINVKDWPIIQQKVYSHPAIKIKQIFIESEQNLLILAGTNVFKLMYMDRTVEYFQDDLMDRILFVDNMVITANQNHILIMNYTLNKPTIMCSTHEREYLGTHNLIFKTMAECDREYIGRISKNGYINQNNNLINQNNNLINDKNNLINDNNNTNNIDSNNANNINNNNNSNATISFNIASDICTYTTYKNIHIWSVAKLPLKPVGILVLIFTIFLIVMLIWLVLVKFRMYKAQNHLKYISEEGHINLVEEDVAKSNRDTEEEKPNSDTAGYKTDEELKENKNTYINDKLNYIQEDPNKDLYTLE